MGNTEKAKSKSVSQTAFGARNRARLIDLYFSERTPPKPDEAWRHVYALLLWIDRTTGLAHCYESDKSQPGKPWYPRSLAFHAWVAQQFGQPPDKLTEGVDWLFRRATADLANYLLARQAKLIEKSAAQRAPYKSLGFPEPGEDPELIAVVQEVLGAFLNAEPPEEKWRELVQRVRQHVTQENKRKNLVGEGFEDVLASVIERTLGARAPDVATRRLLQTVPGFANEKTGEKPNRVDVVALGPDNVRRLITAKWSIRADREKQFQTEFANYVAAKSDLKPFEYTLVTNEFDPARLVRACEAMTGNSQMFTHVVHINTAALRAAYGGSLEDSMRRVLEYIDADRLVDLGDWITSLEIP